MEKVSYVTSRIVIATKEAVEENHLPVELVAVKTHVHCTVCGNSWSVFYRDQNDLIDSPRSNWWICSKCHGNPDEVNHG